MSIPLLEIIYTLCGFAPLCLLSCIFFDTPRAIAFSILTSALLSCIDLECGGLIGWWTRTLIVPAFLYLVYAAYRLLPTSQKTIKTAIKINKQVLPSLKLLASPSNKSVTHEDQREKLLQVLQEFGIQGNIHGMQSGPAVTMYEFEPAAGLKISKIITLADDIARSVSAMSVRIAKVPGKNFIGIEVSNPTQATVYLQEVLADAKFQDAILPLGLGKDIAGKPMIEDLAKMPHLLVAGTTGAGKSVAMHSMLLSLLYKLDHTQLRLLLIDPKMLEFTLYKDIPHLLHPVVTDPKEAITALKWAVKEMTNRYQKMSQCKVRDILSYNQQFESMPYIVIIVDEMADLMAVAGKEIEMTIQRLAQMARASGIHIIMATQRPSVDVITGTIKANFPSRISFRVSSQMDSRTIIGQQGAEQLLGKGDMLYIGPKGHLVRAHGPFVSEMEVQTVTEFLRSLSSPNYVEDITTEEEYVEQENDFNDARYIEAIELVRRTGKASTSFLVTNMGIGYNRASRIIQQMERQGVISEAKGATHTREVLNK